MSGYGTVRSKQISYISVENTFQVQKKKFHYNETCIIQINYMTYSETYGYLLLESLESSRAKRAYILH